MPSPTTKFRLNPQVVFQPMDDEAIIVSLESEEIYKMNRTGTEIVRLIQEGRTFGEILYRLREQFDVAAEVIEIQVSQLLEGLMEAGLIEKSPGQR